MECEGSYLFNGHKAGLVAAPSPSSPKCVGNPFTENQPEGLQPQHFAPQGNDMIPAEKRNPVFSVAGKSQTFFRVRHQV
ncbi:hypothetical protein AA14337_1803 [Acetobacter malorum DSM 14337]|uniref:Uncharacterized protein n=1 Tax=Acetobacter malorum DSM 14337 TaxID=1307910 RepID=A0ABQ0PTC0_9PROT|nr:hypothetical protein AA14337_1803 [Acetobacter malorum DSM 14337]